LFRFGKHVYLSGVVLGLVGYLDDVVVGRLIGMDALGAYGVVKSIAMKPLYFLGKTLTTVTFPAYARIQEYPAKLRTAFARVIGITALIAFPVYGGLALIGPSLITPLLTEKYQAAIPVFVIFCGVNCMRLFISSMSPLFKGIGKPKLEWIQLAAAVLVAIPALVMLSKKFGITGAAAAQSYQAGFALCLGIWMIREHTCIGLRRVLAAVARPLAATAIMAAVLLPVMLWLAGPRIEWAIAISVVGAAIYVYATLKLNQPALSELQTIAGSLVAERTPVKAADAHDLHCG